MSSILESVPWGKPALDLIKHAKDLDPERPAVIHIRHSERPTMDLDKDALVMPLSPRGEKASYELGNSLPITRKYYFYHTDRERTVTTASKIQHGIRDNSGIAEIVGEIPLVTIIDVEEASKIIRGLNIRDDYQRAKILFNSWMSGFYPSWVIKPFTDFGQTGAYLMQKYLRGAESNDVHVWVTHENWVAAFLMQWLGDFDFDWVSFLDGFILQFYDDHMMAYFRDSKKKLNYPYWWNSME